MRLMQTVLSITCVEVGQPQRQELSYLFNWVFKTDAPISTVCLESLTPSLISSLQQVYFSNCLVGSYGSFSYITLLSGKFRSPRRDKIKVIPILNRSSKFL